MAPITVPLRSRRRERVSAFQKIQHAIPAVGLLGAGLDTLRHGAHGFELGLVVLEIGTSVLLIAALARSLRAARASGHRGLHHPHGVDWIEVWAAGVLFAEAAERWHLKHHIARPIILTGLVTLGLGLFHGRMSVYKARRQSLRITDSGIYIGGRPFRALTATWKEIAAITVTPTTAEIRTRTGRIRRLNLSDLEHAADVRLALEEAQRRVASLPA
jgi:hypothetical protein